MSLVINLDGLRFEAIALRIPSQETYDKDIRIGLLHIGSILIPGKQYQRGRTINITSGTESTETQGGVLYSRNYRPSRRTFRIGWTEGIDISTLQGDNPDPDYWTASLSGSKEPIAIANDVPYLLQGLLDYLQGEKTPIVYLPFIEKSNNPRELLRDDEQALCVLVGDIQIESVLGNDQEARAESLGEFRHDDIARGFIREYIPVSTFWRQTYASSRRSMSSGLCIIFHPFRLSCLCLEEERSCILEDYPIRSTTKDSRRSDRSSYHKIVSRCLFAFLSMSREDNAREGDRKCCRHDLLYVTTKKRKSEQTFDERIPIFKGIIREPVYGYPGLDSGTCDFSVENEIFVSDSLSAPDDQSRPDSHRTGTNSPEELCRRRTN